MSATLKLIYHNLIKSTVTDKKRFIFNQFNLDDRLTGLVGPRGAGKTTLLLQYIKTHFQLGEAFYFSADHIYFTENKIYDFITDLYQHEELKIFFIDEIHKYKNWSQELKNLYDGFPDLKIIFSGSSSLDLIKGSYDLSRRANLYHMPGMSFREYLYLNDVANINTIPLQKLLDSPDEVNEILGEIPKVILHFQAYLKHGYYPFYYDSPLTYNQKLLRIIEKTIFEDIADFYHLKTPNLYIMKKTLMYLASIKPGSASTHNISKNMSIADKSMISFLSHLSETGLVTLIYPAEPGNTLLRRPEKIFLNNTNLYYAIAGQINNHLEIGTIRELFFINMMQNAGYETFYSKKGDYESNGAIFEVGGKAKTTKQIKNIPNSFLIKDDLLIANRREIPLWYFGFLY